MAYRFNTYIELGEAVKKAKPEFANRNSESLGLEFAEKYGNELDVRVSEEDDRATFAYDPEEGFNILKTLGNLPSSAGAIAEDLATAVMNPLDTAEALGRGAAGAAELALGTDISPENKRVAEKLGRGIAESAGFDKVGDEFEFTGRGIQERPLDILGMLAGGTSVAAKGASLGARGVGRAARAVGGTDAGGAAASVAKAAERVGATAQALDPTLVVPKAGYRAAKAVTKGTAKAGLKAGKFGLGVGMKAGNRFVVEPLRVKYEGSKAKAAIDDVTDAVEGATEFAPGFVDRFREVMGGVTDTVKGVTREQAYDALRRGIEKVEEVSTEGIKAVSGGRAEPVKAGSVFDGLISAWFGFTTGLGQNVIQKVIDYSKLSDQSFRQVMLDVVNKKPEPGRAVGEDVLDELTKATKKYQEKMQGASKEARTALKMDEIDVDMPGLKSQIIQRFNKGGDLSRYGVRIKQVAQEDPAVTNIRADGQIITAPQTDAPTKYEVILDEGGEIVRLMENPGAIREAFENILNNDGKKVYDLDLSKRAVDDAKDAGVTKTAQAALQQLRDMIYETIIKSYETPQAEQVLGRTSSPNANFYQQAMAQYEDYTNRMRLIGQTLGIKDPQRKFGDTDFEVIRQSGDPQQVLRSVLKAFGDNESELSFANLQRLADETNNPYLIPKVLGYSMRPLFGDGLVVRSEISQLGRGLLGYNLMGGLLTPISLAQFSPRFGGMALSYLYSPDGVRLLKDKATGALDAVLAGSSRVGQAAGKARQSVADRYKGLRKLAAERTGKSERDVTPRDVTETVTALEKLQNIVQETMSREQQSTLSALLQAGAMTERAQSGGERAQERETLLSRLGRTQGNRGN